MFRVLSYFLILFISFNSYNSMAQGPELLFCGDKELNQLPIQAGGRTKPLSVHAKELVKFIFVPSSLNGMKPTEAFCLLTLKAFGVNSATLAPQIKIDHVFWRTFLGISSEEKGVSPEVVEARLLDLRMELAKRKVNDSEKKELSKIIGRYQSYQEMVTGISWTIPSLSTESKKIEWKPIVSELTEEKVTKSGAPLIAFFQNYKKVYDELENQDYLLEYRYYQIHPFGSALILSLLALLSLFIFKTNKIGLLFTATSIAMQIVGFTLRIYISGRAPITNMYETVVFSGFGCLVVALILYSFKKETFFWAAGLTYNVLTLMMANFANEMLSPSIAPLVPVLRDNFWLSTHVTTVILSYAALALSWILANMAIIQNLRKKLVPAEEQRLTALIYAAVKVGVVLLSAGVILGGVWADYSWGRFWGWDPKETWSLIVLLIYIAILHGKHTNWITPKRFIPSIAAAFMSVMMAWFGVNYILAAGLHSYGFSEGGAVFLISFFAVQISILAIHWAKNKKLI
jgi:cytochrome c-type biogenesis protein CcsB